MMLERVPGTHTSGLTSLLCTASRGHAPSFNSSRLSEYAVPFDVTVWGLVRSTRVEDA